eukprot:scaffold71509_cov63-Phaeocystis_antarctica.AAC.3
MGNVPSAIVHRQPQLVARPLNASPRGRPQGPCVVVSATEVRIVQAVRRARKPVVAVQATEAKHRLREVALARLGEAEQRVTEEGPCSGSPPIGIGHGAARVSMALRDHGAQVAKRRPHIVVVHRVVRGVVSVHFRRRLDDLELALLHATNQRTVVALRVSLEPEIHRVVCPVVRVPDHLLLLRGLLLPWDLGVLPCCLGSARWRVDVRRADGIREDDARGVRPDGAAKALVRVMQRVQHIRTFVACLGRMRSTRLARRGGRQGL